MLINNFLGGIAWSLGVTVGGAIILAILGFLLSNVNYVPFVGEFVLGIVNYIAQNQNPLQLQ
ncbi:hypothetical protein D3C83_133450 [compost metagenome]